MSNKKHNISKLKILLFILLTTGFFILEYSGKGFAYDGYEIYEPILSEYEKSLINKGFVDIQTIDPSIEVDLKYASKNNFMETNVYRDLQRCYLRREAALKLKKANDFLKKLRPDLRLLVADGFRPRRVQRIMWSFVENTPMQDYVANPDKGSMHNYGAAVDITIVDLYGNRLDMGTPIDHFGILSQPLMEDHFLKLKELNEVQVKNRKLLRHVMTKAGFRQLSIEWWHYNAFSKDEIRKKYNIVE